MTLKICVFGAGAIGGLIAARLSQTDAEVSCLARGSALDAISRHGLRLISDEGEITARIACSDDPQALGPQDFVLLTVKAQSIPEIADAIQPLLGGGTSVVTLQNGLPWWFFQSLRGPYNNLLLQKIDPDGALAASIDHSHVIGGVIYPAAKVIQPGIIRHVMGDRLALGEPGGGMSARLVALTNVMQQAGFTAQAVETIRNEICLKWASNAAINPVSVLTGASIADMIESPGVYQVLFDVMKEIASLCDQLGCPLPLPVEDVLSGARKMGQHKSSMLQDFEQSRELELAPLLGSVQELSAHVGHPTPTFDAIYNLLQLKLGQDG